MDLKKYIAREKSIVQQKKVDAKIAIELRCRDKKLMAPIPASRTDRLNQTIEGLLNQSIPKDRHEIIVVILETLNLENLHPSKAP